MLQVEHLTKRYGAVTAVDDLSFEIAGAGVYGFLGPNGAGKSTTMNIMTGCLSATAGTVKISGYDIYESPREAKRRVGYLPEQPPLYLGEVPAEFLRFVGEAKGLRGAELRRQIDAVVEETGIGDMRQRRISALSKGYRQRVGIAQALLGEPDTVILDEPTVGLDPIQILEIRALIASLGESRVVLIAADPTTDKYSFKIEFDHYVDGQTCFGLDKLVLNNNYADATSMKEALIYDMYRYFGADASLYNYAKISVNGEYWGVYLALEAVEDSFMLRNYGAQSGELYKPDSMNIGGGFDMGGFGGFSLGGGGADLNYTDDDPDSYSTIWEGAKTDAADADCERVITALRHISEGSELETYMDVDNLLRYMAVHVFSVNEDSLSGMMAHNYYLYEYDGHLNIIPWDYNLALGGMSGSSAASVVNEAIDKAFSGTNFFDTLMENETYHAHYCEYLRRLVDEYINGGGFGGQGGASGAAPADSGSSDMPQLPGGL